MSVLLIETTAVSSRAVLNRPDTGLLLEDPSLAPWALLVVSVGGGVITILLWRLKTFKD